MYKLRKAFVTFFLLCLAMPGIALAQKPEKITVARDGSITTEQGKVLDRKLFAFSTYDSGGKSEMIKGRARSRPSTMYIDESVVRAYNTNNLTAAQRKRMQEYLRAESKVKPLTARSKITNPKPTYVRPIVTSRLTEVELEALATKIAAKIPTQTTGLSAEQFQLQINQIVDNAKAELRAYAENIKPGLVTTNVVSEPTQTFVEWLGSSIASAFDWTWGWLVYIFWWIIGILFSIWGIVIIAVAVLLLFGPWLVRWLRDRSQKAPSILKEKTHRTKRQSVTNETVEETREPLPDLGSNKEQAFES